MDLAADNPRDEITRLEARLEDLAELQVRCREFGLSVQLVMAGGWLVLLWPGGISYDVAMIVLAVILGGLAMCGLIAVRMNKLSAELREVEAKRAALISGLDRRKVADGACPDPRP